MIPKRLLFLFTPPSLGEGGGWGFHYRYSRTARTVLLNVRHIIVVYCSNTFLLQILPMMHLPGGAPLLCVRVCMRNRCGVPRVSGRSAASGDDDGGSVVPKFLVATTTVRNFRPFGGEKTDKSITCFYTWPSRVPCTHIIVRNIDKKKKKEAIAYCCYLNNRMEMCQ